MFFHLCAFAQKLIMIYVGLTSKSCPFIFLGAETRWIFELQEKVARLARKLHRTCSATTWRSDSLVTKKERPFPFFATKGANSKKIWSKRRVLDTDDVKQKPSLSVWYIVSWFFFFCFTSSVAVQEVNSENIIYLSLQPCKNYEGDSCTGILMKVGKTYFRV